MGIEESAYCLLLQMSLMSTTTTDTGAANWMHKLQVMCCTNTSLLVECFQRRKLETVSWKEVYSFHYTAEHGP